MGTSIKTKSLAPLGFSNYTIDTTGRVKNTKTNKYIATHINNSGYVRISLTDDNGEQVNRLLSRLVAMTFIPNPDKLTDVGHKSGIKTDCSVGNLEWTSRSDNIKKMHADKAKTQAKCKKSKK